MSTANIDWSEDNCWILGHSLAVFENKIFVIGGIATLTSEKRKLLPPSDDNELKVFANSHVRAFDFSKSTTISGNADLPQLSYITGYYPRVYGAQLLNGRVQSYILGGTTSALNYTLDLDGSLLNSTELSRINGTTDMFTMDRTTSDFPWFGMSRVPMLIGFNSVSAIDVENNVGWVLPGWDVNNRNFEPTKSMLRLDMNSLGDPAGQVVGDWLGDWEAVEGQDYSFEGVQGGQLMVFLGKVGSEGLLLVLAGLGARQYVSRPGSFASLRTIKIYDIASNTWYTQATTASADGFPTESVLESSCALLVSAQDSSSHSIYIYGGRTWEKDVTGSVWVLSIPSFTWILVYPETADSILFGHKCGNLGNRFMFVYGGAKVDLTYDETPLGGDECNVNKGMKLFDLSSLAWTTNYEIPDAQSGYLLPEKITEIIGGGTTGGATLVTPKNGFNNTDLEKIFAIPETTITTAPETTIMTTTPPSETNTSTSNPNLGLNNSDTIPVGAIVGSIIGSLVLGALLVYICLLMRKRRRKGSQEIPPSVPNPVLVEQFITKPELEAPSGPSRSHFIYERGNVVSLNAGHESIELPSGQPFLHELAENSVREVALQIRPQEHVQRT